MGRGIPELRGGQRLQYFLPLRGMQFELVSYPGRRAYEKDAACGPWHPGHPAD